MSNVFDNKVFKEDLENAESFYEYVQLRLKLHNYTMADLANHLGFCYKTVWELLKGRRTLSIQMACKIAEFLKADSAEFIDRYISEYIYKY